MDVNRLFADLQRCPKYSKKECIELGRRWKENGDADAREQLIISVMPWVVHVAKQYQDRGIAMSDLVSSGMLGAVLAADHYDHTRNIAFTTYSTFWIKQVIRRELATNTHVIRLPSHTAGDISGKSKEIRDGFERVSKGILSINDTRPDGSGPKHECTDNSIQDSVADVDEMQRTRNIIQEAIQFLDIDEKNVILSRLRGDTLKTVGDKINCTRERVRQIETKALERLRTIVEKIEKKYQHTYILGCSLEELPTIADASEITYGKQRETIADKIADFLWINGKSHIHDIVVGVDAKYVSVTMAIRRNKKRFDSRGKGKYWDLSVAERSAILAEKRKVAPEVATDANIQ